jgi:spore coat polysaccharide biosynthesis predicted glycosyltransferase SpsG
MGQFEKKIFTNLYWNTNKKDLVIIGQYGTEARAIEKIKDPVAEPTFIYQDTIGATVLFEYNKEIVTTQKKEEENVPES